MRPAPSATESIAILFLGLSLIARFSWLGSAPYGLDIDEAAILYWAQKAWREKRFLLYAPEFTEWEMLPGYVFAWLGGGRIVPSVLAVGEIFVLWRIAARELGREAAWIAAAFLASCPWHFYYSRILGTCSGVSFLVLLGIWLRRNGPATVGTHLTGLLYYTTYRLAFLRACLESVRDRNWRRSAVLLSALGGVLAILWLSESPTIKFFTRGAYNVSRPRMDIARNYWAAARAPFSLVPPEFAQTTREFMADYVHAGFTRSLGNHPPLGWGFSLAALMGIWALARRRFAAPLGLRRELLFGAAGLLALGFMGPSFSRLLLLLPFFALAAAWGTGVVAKNFPPLARATLVATLLSVTAWGEWECLFRLGDRALMEPVFHGRFLDLKAYVERTIPDPSPETVFLITEYGYPSARHVGEGASSLAVFPPIQYADLEKIMNLQSRGRTQYLITDEVPADAAVLSGYDKRSQVSALTDRLRGRANILSEEPIHWEGKRVGYLMRIQWPFERDPYL